MGLAVRPGKIISGGQTGADLGALRAAAALGIPTGGWMPREFRTELGSRQWYAKRYGMREHVSHQYGPRTTQNAREADLTVIIGDLRSPGSRRTLAAVEEAGRPVEINPTAERLRQVVSALTAAAARPIVLNVAGNRESGNRGIEAYVFALLLEAWGDGTIPAPVLLVPRLFGAPTAASPPEE